MSEAKLMHAIQMEVSRLGGRVFRNNVGIFTGSDGSFVRTGLAVGSSDLIGWFPDNRALTVTHWTTRAVFLAIEIKSSKGRLRPEQKQFIDCVKKAGGLAFVARSVDDVRKELACW